MTRPLQFLLWIAGLVALSVALWPQAPGAPGSTADKLQHFAAFFTLAVLGSLGYSRIPLLKLFAGLVLFGALIELAQLYPAINRQADWADLLADGLGAAMGVLAATRLRLQPGGRRRRGVRPAGGTRQQLAGSDAKPTAGKRIMSGAGDIFERLKQDHDRHRDLIGRVENAAVDEERGRLFEQLTIELKSHASAEEQALYSTMMRKPPTTDETRHSVAEHHEIEVALNDLAATDLTSDEWMDKFSDLKHDYLHHIEEEEEEHFPDFSRYLTTEDEQHMRDVFERRKQAESTLAEITPEKKEEAKE